MVATLDRETVVTLASRAVGHVPARWVSAVETDGVPGAIHARLFASSHGAHRNQRIGDLATGAGTYTAAAGELGAVFGVTAPHVAALIAAPDESVPFLLDSAVLQELLLVLQSAGLTAAGLTRILSSGSARALERPQTDAPSPNAAVRAADDLREWLGVTVDEVARLAGVSRSAVLYWKRENAQPRPTPARNLFRVHALVRGLRDAVAPGHPMDVLSHVPDGAGASPYDLLMAGRYDDAERLLRPILFRRDQQPVRPERYVRWPEEEPTTPDVAEPLELRSPVRRARRVSLPK